MHTSIYDAAYKHLQIEVVKGRQTFRLSIRVGGKHSDHARFTYRVGGNIANAWLPCTNMWETLQCAITLILRCESKIRL